jgi:hypothetical protein
MKNYCTSSVPIEGAEQIFEVPRAVNHAENPDFLLSRAIEDQVFRESRNWHSSNALEFVGPETASCA